MAIEIGRFRLRQLPRVLAIERVCFGAAAYPREMFMDLYRECGAWFYVAKRRGRIAGYIVSCAGDQRGEVVSLAVAPEHRRAGVGRTLILRTIRALRRRRVRRVELMVRTTSAPAIALYRSFGFRTASTVPRYYEDGSDAFHMMLRL